MSVETIQQSINSVIDYVAQHVDEARYSDSPAKAVIEDGLRCRAEGPDGASLISDMPSVIGGGGSAPSPGWMLRAALANCDATVIAMRAAHQGIHLTELSVIVESTSDDRGLLGMDEQIYAGPYSVSTRVRISARNASPQQLREIVAWAEAHSPVADAIRRAVPSETEVEVV